MQVSNSQLKLVADHNLRPIIARLIVNGNRSIIKDGGGIGALVNNTGGSIAGPIFALPAFTSFVHTTGATLAPRAGWNTSVGQVDDAIAVLRKHLAEKVQQPLGFTPLAANTTGAVAQTGTVPAVNNALAGVDGTGNNALDLTEANSVLSKTANNFASLLRVYNQLSVTLGSLPIRDNSGGVASKTKLVDVPDSIIAVGGGGNHAVSLAQANAILSNLKANLSFVTDQINTVLLAAGNSANPLPLVLVP